MEVDAGLVVREPALAVLAELPRVGLPVLRPRTIETIYFIIKHYKNKSNN